jgi:hypothetical protein
MFYVFIAFSDTATVYIKMLLAHWPPSLEELDFVIAISLLATVRGVFAAFNKTKSVVILDA